MFLMTVLAVQSITAGPAHAQEDERLREYEIKAAFLYHFVRFTEWPETALKPHQEHVVVCVLGEDPFGPALDQLEGKQAKGRQLLTRRVSRIQDVTPCNVLYISSSEKSKLPSYFEVLEKMAILTVGDTEGFTRQGGMIRLYRVKNKIRFEVRLDAAEQAGLRLSAKMLRLAKIV